MKNLVEQIEKTVKHWYIPLIVGILLVLLGLWTFSAPLESYLALSVLFSISFFTSGFFETIFALSNRKQLDNWIWYFLLGFMTLIVGTIMLIHPEISMVSLPLYIGFMVMFRSFGAIGLAIDLQKSNVPNSNSLMLLGFLGILFSFILIWNPIFAGITVVVWTGIGILTFGILNIILALKLRKLNSKK
ncbi:MAG: DUF308 domain-containing protein [Flavobacteriales bacterium]|nr:DUF308 domain-containing protein [Flavobacteriales bacterium]